MSRTCPNHRFVATKLFHKLICSCVLVLSASLLTSPVVWANPITTLDFRDGITEEKLSAYHLAVLGGPDFNRSAKLIKLLVSADKGFDAGWLRVPKHKRILRVNVVIYTFRGSVITAPIRVNLFELDTQSIKHINLEVALR